MIKSGSADIIASPLPKFKYKSGSLRQICHSETDADEIYSIVTLPLCWVTLFKLSEQVFFKAIKLKTDLWGGFTLKLLVSQLVMHWCHWHEQMLPSASVKQSCNEHCVESDMILCRLFSCQSLQYGVWPVLFSGNVWKKIKSKPLCHLMWAQKNKPERIVCSGKLGYFIFHVYTQVYKDKDTFILTCDLKINMVGSELHTFFFSFFF